MGMRKEYTEALILSKDEINSIKRAQFEIRIEGFTNVNENKLKEGLSTFSSILSLAFKLPTAVTLAAGVISFVTSEPSDLDNIITLCRNGEDYLEQLWNMMDDHPDYDRVEVELPFLEFVDEGFRIVQGEGILKRIHTGSGWIIL